MAGAVLDTCVISHFLRPLAATQTPRLHARVLELVTSESPALAAVTLYEVHAGLRELLERGEGLRKFAAWRLFCSTAEVLGLDGADWKGWTDAADLRARCRRSGLHISEGDLLIAATAHYHHRTLVTADRGLRDNLAKIGFELPVEFLVVE